MIFSRKINHFMKVIEKGSYLKASEALFLTSSALRHSIYELERSVSSKLFHRSNGGITLTDNGRHLYDSLYPIYNKANRVYNEFLQDNSNKGMLKIFMDGFYYPKIVNELDNILSQLRREIIISQVSGSSLKELISGHCDIAISIAVGGEFSVPDNISNVHLSSEKLGLLVSKSTHRKYGSMHKMFQSEKIFIRGTMLHHPIIEHISNRMKIYNLDCNFMGLPDVSDVSMILSTGNGFTLVSADTLKDRTFNQDIFEFIPDPFPEPFIFKRNLFFDSDYHPELSQLANILIK